MKVKYNVYSMIFLLVFLVAGCGKLGVNRTIQIADGERYKGDLNSVNGAIIIGKNCEIIGSCHAINGAIEVKDSAIVHSLLAVNGSISIGERVKILGEASTVNGSIQFQKGVNVKDEVSTINGDIEMNNTTIEYNVTTINGDISLRNKSVIEGDIVIRARRGYAENTKPLLIMINDSSLVQGDIINRDKNRSVKLILASGGRVAGQIREIEVTRQ